MMLAGYRDGIAGSPGNAYRVGCLHEVQVEQTRAGMRSLCSPSGELIGGFLWFDSSRLGKKQQVQDIACWANTLDAIVAFSFWAAADNMSPSDSVGIVVTWTKLSGQIQRRYSPAGRGAAIKDGRSDLSPGALARDLLKRKFDIGIPLDQKIPLNAWHRLVEHSPAALAPFIHVGTAISGAGTTFVVSIYVHPAHTAFTVLPAASIVGTTRGKRMNIILAPASPPANTYMGRLACLLPEIGGLAGRLSPNDGPILRQISDGADRVGRSQRILGYNILDATQSWDRLHGVLALNSHAAPPRCMFREANGEKASFIRLPAVLRISGASAPGEPLPSGDYFRGYMVTHLDYALVTAGPWCNAGYRLSTDHKTEFYLCGTKVQPQLFVPGRRMEDLKLTFLDNGENDAASWVSTLSDGRSFKEIPLIEWIRAPIVGRLEAASQAGVVPSWVEPIEQESIPPMMSLEPAGLNEVNTGDEDYELQLYSFNACRVAVPGLGNKRKPLPDSGGAHGDGTAGEDGARDTEEPAAFVLESLRWDTLLSISPLVKWGAVVFNIKGIARNYSQSLMLDVVRPFLPGGSKYQAFQAAVTNPRIREMVKQRMLEVSTDRIAQELWLGKDLMRWSDRYPRSSHNALRMHCLLPGGAALK
jgi:hypothetical protein